MQYDIIELLRLGLGSIGGQELINWSLLDITTSVLMNKENTF
jgi:hypothetical protein